MKPKQIIKIAADVLMTFMLLLLMAYSMAGEAVHEWIGVGMFSLFVMHHILNNRWSSNLLRGKYTPFRIFQTVMVILVLFSMAGSMVSGIVISKHVFSFLPISEGCAWAKTLHILCAYWGFVFISLHLGLHWNMMMGMAKRMFKKPSAVRKWLIRGIGFLIACYGARALIIREVLSYMFLKIQLIFFDSEEPLILFLTDYIALMGLFVFIGHYIAKILRHNWRPCRLPVKVQIMKFKC